MCVCLDVLPSPMRTVGDDKKTTPCTPESPKQKPMINRSRTLQRIFSPTCECSHGPDSSPRRWRGSRGRSDEGRKNGKTGVARVSVMVGGRGWWWWWWGGREVCVSTNPAIQRDVIGLMCLHLTWPGSQTSRCMCGVAHVLRLLDGKVRQGDGQERDVGIGLEVTVKEQQG